MGKTARNAFIICLGALCACMSRAEMEKRIIEACKNGDDKLVEKLVSKDSSLVSYADSFGRTPLHYAETERIAEILSEAGADIGSRDELDQTPLHTAANAEVALFLINKGADVNARDGKGATPLHAAAFAGEVEAVRLLLAKGADRDLVDGTGVTPRGATAIDWPTTQFVYMLLGLPKPDREQVEANRAAVAKLLDAAGSGGD